MILFVGDKIKLGGLAEAVMTRLNDSVAYVDPATNILDQENEILAAAIETSYILYDMDQYYNDAEELIKIIKRIYRTKKAKPILLVPTDNPKNEIVKNAIANQFRYFVNGGSYLGEQKDQLEKILLGFFDANENEELTAAKEEVAKEEETLKNFTQKLYDAKQREDEKEKTIVIKKKRKEEVLYGIIKDTLRVIFSIVDVALVALALIVLIYPEPRTALISTLYRILAEFRKLI